MSAIVLATVRDRVRRLVGSPDTTELPNATIEGFINDETLDWFNRRRPALALTSLTTVADQQIYDSKPSNAYRVTRVFYRSSDYQILSPSYTYLPESFDFDKQLSGYNVVDNAAVVEDVLRKLETYKRNFNGSGWEETDGKIWLEPRPSTSGDTVYFFYTYPLFSAITGVDDIWSDVICYYAGHMCLDFLTLRRGMIRSGRNFTGGGGANEKEKSKEYLEKAETLYPSLVIPFSRG